VVEKLRPGFPRSFCFNAPHFNVSQIYGRDGLVKATKLLEQPVAHVTLRWTIEHTTTSIASSNRHYASQ